MTGDDLARMVRDIVDDVPRARAVVVLSADGTPRGATDGMTEADTRTLSAAPAGLHAFSRATSRFTRARTTDGGGRRPGRRRGWRMVGRKRAPMPRRSSTGSRASRCAASAGPTAGTPPVCATRAEAAAPGTPRATDARATAPPREHRPQHPATALPSGSNRSARPAGSTPPKRRGCMGDDDQDRHHRERGERVPAGPVPHHGSTAGAGRAAFDRSVERGSTVRRNSGTPGRRGTPLPRTTMAIARGARARKTSPFRKVSSACPASAGDVSSPPEQAPPWVSA